MLSTNLVIDTRTSTPVVTVQGDNCDYGILVVKARGAITISVQAFDSTGTEVTGFEEAMTAGELAYLAIDDTVSYVTVSMRSGSSWTPLNDTNGNAQFNVTSTFRMLQLQDDGSPVRPVLYQSTTNEIMITNASGAGGTWSWVSDSQETRSGTFATYPSWQTYTLTSGNGTLTLDYDNAAHPQLAIKVYDMTGNTVTIDGPDETDAHPMAITPDANDLVTVYNATDDSISAQWEGDTSTPPELPSQTPLSFSTANAPGDWYIDWDDTHDPKVIVKRPPVLTTSSGYQHARSA